MKASYLRADRDLVATWVRGWALARETPPPLPDSGGWRVEVGWPQQRLRYVFSEIGEGLLTLATTLTEPYIFLKACVPPQVLQAVLPTRWALQAPGFLMTCAATRGGRQGPLPPGYFFQVQASQAVSLVQVLTATGELAASGRVVAVDDALIYDRIETQPAHQRRGLGRALMKRLAAVAQEKGARRGLLVATPTGRALYETLGWQVHACYTTAVIPA